MASEHTSNTTAVPDDMDIISEVNSDMDILDQPIIKEVELCEDDMLKQICYQVLDRIEFEYVPNAERDALCRIIMSRGLMDLKEGRVTSLCFFTFQSSKSSV